MLKKNGKPRVNTSQNVPRASVELNENSYEYQMFILGLLFINQLVMFCLCYILSSDSFLGQNTSSWQLWQSYFLCWGTS